MEVIETSSGEKIWLLPVIRGLESERETVRRAFDKSRTKALAISTSKEELKALQEYDGEEVQPSNFEEEIYMEFLSKFGKVSKPPPCFLEARDLAKEKKLRFFALDLDDDDFTEAYVTSVSTIEMMTQSMSQNRMRRRRFKAKTPEEFVLEFDALINRKKGFRRLEKSREEHIAKRISELTKGCSSLLAVIEMERIAGVKQSLPNYLPR